MPPSSGLSEAEQQQQQPQSPVKVYYSIHSQPADFAYVLKPIFVEDVKKLWKLEKQVKENHELREKVWIVSDP